MNGPYSAITVMERFVYSSLLADGDLEVALGGAGRIHPDPAPSSVTTRHLVYDDYGSVEVVKPVGGPIGMVTMNWAITAWEPSNSRQALEPATEAVMAIMIQPTLRGKTHRFVDGARVWSLFVDDQGPEMVDKDHFPAGTWAPVREVYRLSLQQVT